MGPVNQRTARRLHPHTREYVLRVSNVHTSLHQASKWGMRGLQGSFPRCKKQLPTESRKRRSVLESIVLIHNYRTELVGSNQIKTVFYPEYERVISLDGYDRISKYYLRPEDFDRDGEDNDYEF